MNASGRPSSKGPSAYPLQVAIKRARLPQTRQSYAENPWRRKTISLGNRPVAQTHRAQAAIKKRANSADAEPRVGPVATGG